MDYRYAPDELEENHECFVAGGQIRIANVPEREQEAVNKAWRGEPA